MEKSASKIGSHEYKSILNFMENGLFSLPPKYKRQLSYNIQQLNIDFGNLPNILGLSIWDFFL